MALYVTLADMNARLPGPFLTQALDDDNDGASDSAVWEAIATAVSQEIDGILSLRFTVPFTGDVPPFVLYAAQILASAALYARRGVEEKLNPWAAEARDVRAKLKEIAAGQAPLGPGYPLAQATVDIIGEDSKTTSKSKKLSV
jgi:phage gp36-like protein